nr:hypothetical protein [uncultured Mediterranean phage uvMED]
MNPGGLRLERERSQWWLCSCQGAMRQVCHPCLTIVSQVRDTYQRWLSEKNSLPLADTNSIAPERAQGVVLLLL